MTTPSTHPHEARDRALRAAGIDPHRVPEHVAVIMDGNGRWAKRRGEERVFGHAHGVESVRATVEAALESGVRYLTLYAFSTENWNRPKEEVDALMDLLVKTLVQEAMELASKGVRLRAIGDVGVCLTPVKRSWNGSRKAQRGGSLGFGLGLELQRQVGDGGGHSHHDGRRIEAGRNSAVHD